VLFRRPAPSLLFTAVAATVVMLPWAISGLPGDDNDKPASRAPQLAQQPLTGLGGGETVREVHQDTPFSMVALTAEDLTGTSAKVRAKNADGSWGPWYDAETLEGVGPDSAVPRGTEPVFVGRTTTVQISVTRPVGAAPSGAAPKASATPGLGYVPANVEQPFAQNINAVLISPPQAPVDTLPLPSAVTMPGQPPNIISRAQWGADEGMRCGNTVYDNGIRAAVVHHTAGSNDYEPRIRPASSGRSTSTTPANWAGATSPTTRWSTSTARSSRVAQAAWTNRSRGHTPAASTATPGAWRCWATSTSCPRLRSN
jgi:uncharacterized protein with LGFP repeats